MVNVEFTAIILVGFISITTGWKHQDESNRCANGGTPKQPGCICTPDWEGLLCTAIRCHNGGQRIAGNAKECTCPENYAPPNCAFCFSSEWNAKMGNQCTQHPDYHLNGSRVAREITTTKDPVVRGNVNSFYYAFGFILLLLILASTLAIQQIIRLYRHEQDRLPLATKQEEHDDELVHHHHHRHSDVVAKPDGTHHLYTAEMQHNRL